MSAAEADIRAAREKAMANVRTVAAETAEAIVEKLSGKAASKAEVDRALAGRA
jgi:F-type H+-transporting ATPase subunit b